jgi:Serine/threonine protein kinase
MFGYRILKYLSESPFGTVIVLQKESGQDAEKIVIGKYTEKNPNLGTSEPNRLGILRKEKKYLEVLKGGPFIIRYHETLESEREFLMVMEYLKIKNLTQLFSRAKKNKCVQESDVLFYASEIILALEYMHEKGIVHRDLKPDNIGIDHDGHVAVYDFGLSENIPPTGSPKLKMFCGTFLFRAPEIGSKEGYDESVDWFSLGATLYNILTRRYSYITANALPFPREVSQNAINLINGLLKWEPQERLGGGGRGAKELKSHPLFHGIDWNKVLNKEVESPMKKRYRERMHVSIRL